MALSTPLTWSRLCSIWAVRTCSRAVSLQVATLIRVTKGIMLHDSLRRSAPRQTREPRQIVQVMGRKWKESGCEFVGLIWTCVVLHLGASTYLCNTLGKGNDALKLDLNLFNTKRKSHPFLVRLPRLLAASV